MKKYEYKRLHTENIPVMAALLLKRQEVETVTFPMLKNQYLNTDYIQKELKELFGNNVIGIGAFKGEDLKGYILGELKDDTVYLRGRHIWVPYEGIAIEPGQSPELLRRLYEKVSLLWVEHGCFSHYTVIPMGEPSYFQALLQLSFHIEQVHGVLKMTDFKPFSDAADVSVRMAEEIDREALGRMSTIISGHQNISPVYQPIPPELILRIKKGYEGLVGDEDAILFVAEEDGAAIGFQEYEEADAGLMIPENAVELSIAGVFPSTMNKGVGKKLMNESFALMAEKGYENMVADWRITNLASSTFWPKCGFKPVAYRMLRKIDPNILWANFKGHTEES